MCGGAPWCSTSGSGSLSSGLTLVSWVRVRGDGLRVDGPYRAPATLHALAALADALPLVGALPLRVIALVHRIAPLAEAARMGRPDTPPELELPVTRTRQSLGHKRRRITGGGGMHGLGGRPEIS